MHFDQNYWDQAWKDGKTPWDLSSYSPAFRYLFSEIEEKDLRILIPGCGNAYEVDYLLEAGFVDITLIDISPIVCTELDKNYKHTAVKVLCGDFFELTGKYDIIFEQTFFCAFHPTERASLLEKVRDLLAVNGKYMGLLFDRQFEKAGPPFGGSKSDYEVLFSKYFSQVTMEKTTLSIKPRLGSELLFVALV